MHTHELPKQYDPHEAQRRWYAFWLEKGYFHAQPPSNREKPSYCIVIPPPNVTGALHLGHALNNTLQDILIRWRRMQGYATLWVPGTDHAGIATQAVVEKRLLEQEKKTRHDIGREGVVARIWAWKTEYEKRILSQLQQMGCSCDWKRTRFTLDPICARAVRETFFRLFKAGKIVRGKRLVNWDTQLHTAVADDEIYTEDVPGHIWTIKYPVAGSPTGEFLHVATTRPETMLGDTAIAVHPDDPRYCHLIGGEVELPLTGRRIPIIADGVLVDREFGTGCVKVTPAHDANDYQAGLRNGLPMINLLNPDGTYNENAGSKYAGLDRLVVRQHVLRDLQEQGLLEQTEKHLVPLKHSDRSKTPIEPYLSDQWFVRMGDESDGSPGFAQQAIDAVTSGRIKIHPERYAKTYIDWLSEKRDWCISRQLWWGHRIPVWTRTRSPDNHPDHQEWQESVRSASESPNKVCKSPGDTLEADINGGPWEKWGVARKFTIAEDGFVTELICAPHLDQDAEEDLAGRLAAEGFTQDPDVLDTWFSSALWPHSTLGWPEKTPELAAFYPTSVLSTARDIITLWVARMVIFGQFNMGDVPFRDVYIHPVILDGKGERMAKSKGNGVDPVDIIDLYGADALRFGLAALATEMQDIRMPVEKAKLPDGRVVNTSERFELARPFPNKFWNAARLVLMNVGDYDPAQLPAGDFVVESRADFWILGRLHRAAREATTALERFAFAELARGLRAFSWNDFCDWYLEFAKAQLRDEHAKNRLIAQHVALTVLDGLCRLLHPIIPFVTEEVWQALNQVAPRRPDPTTLRPEQAAESVAIAAWPVYHEALSPREEAEAVIAQWQEKITAIRNLRAECGVPDKARIRPIIVASGAVADALREGRQQILSLTGSQVIEIVDSSSRPPGSAVAILGDAEVLLPLEGLVDFDTELARQRKRLADLDKQINGLKNRLEAMGFVAKAPPDIVAQQRTRLADLEIQHGTVARLIAALLG